MTPFNSFWIGRWPPDPAQLGHTTEGILRFFSAMVTDKTGMNTLELAKRSLFNPLGISEYIWGRDRQGIYNGGSGLLLTPRDMAKYGYLILNKGVWDGKQIIPKDFVAESVKTHTTFNAIFGYGYQSWWTIQAEGYYYADDIILFTGHREAMEAALQYFRGKA